MFTFELMKIILAIIACFYLLAPWPVMAQKVNWSPPLSESSKTDYIKVIGQNDNGFYVLRSNHPISSRHEYYSYRNSRFLVSFYSYDMHLLWEKTPDVLKRDARILTFIPVADKLAEISLEWSKPESKFHILWRYYNSYGVADTLYNLLAEDDISAVDDDAAFTITSSKDANSFLIAYENKYERSAQRFTSLICNAEFALVKKSSFTIPLSKKYFNASQFLLTNDHHILLFGVKTDEEKKSRDPDRNYFTLFINNGTEQWKEYMVRTPEKFLTDAGIAADEMNQKIVVAGFYSDKTSYSTAGVFYYDISLATGSADTISYSSFAPSFLYNFLGEQKENYNRELINYSIDRIILRNDGGAVIIAEAVYTTEYSYYDYYLRTFINRRYYHNDNIIQLSVNKDGTMTWSDVIKKEQTSENSDDAYVSYAFATGKGKLRCVFNRYLKRKTQVMLAGTDAMGNEKISELFNEAQDIFILPSAAKQVDENLLVIPAYKGKEFHLAGIAF